jgi:hypothetical protein
VYDAFLYYLVSLDVVYSLITFYLTMCTKKVDYLFGGGKECLDISFIIFLYTFLIYPKGYERNLVL